MNQLLTRASGHGKKTAIISDGKRFSYRELLYASESIALGLMHQKGDLNEQRVAFMVDPGFDYVSVQWGIWRSGGIAVPICISYPSASIEHVLDDAQCSIVVAGEAYFKLLKPLANQRELRIIRVDEFRSQEGSLPDVANHRRAMILYTSGTTGKPKGVVTTHLNIQSQIQTLVKAWSWSEDDQIINVLPLHHVHGIINVVSCALWSGACCEFLPKFSTKAVFDAFLKGQINVFMAVPTIYYKLIAYWDKLEEDQQGTIRAVLEKFRLMISGSAALPISVMDKWKQVSGQTLLERYGMTEIGMAISNPYEGTRKPGHIGQPLPGMEVRLVDEDGSIINNGESGEIQVKGPNVFKEYWNRPDATAEAFTGDGWFKTGDIAIYAGDSYRIIGRNSVDIIKSGGYKISALEIEEVLRKHPSIKDCGVVGIPDEEWDELICASLIPADGPIDLEEVQAWIREQLPGYKVPRQYIIQEDLPRNVMGKVTKNELKKLFTERT